MKRCVKCGKTLGEGEEVWSAATEETSGRVVRGTWWCNDCHVKELKRLRSEAPSWMVGLSPECLKAFEKRYPIASKPLSGEPYTFNQYQKAIGMLRTYFGGWQDALTSKEIT